MIDKTVFFKNHFDTRRIGDEKLRKTCEIILQRMISNNPGAIYDTQIADTTTAYTNYFGAITDEDTKTAIKEGSTIAVNNALDSFKESASRKEGLVRSTYGVDSPTYQEFYPHGISEYSNCTLTNCETLMDRMVAAATAHAADVGAPFVTLFTNHKTTFHNARTAQLALIGDVSGKKEATAANRAIVEVQVMKDVLFIAYNNVGNLAAADTYIDFSFLNPPKQKTFSGPVGSSASLNIDKRNYSADSVIYLRNPGSTKLAFGIMLNETDAASAIVLASGEEREVTASELGDVAANHFLNVTNIEAFDGEYSVTVEL